MNVCVSVLRAMRTTHRVVTLDRGVLAPHALVTIRVRVSVGMGVGRREERKNGGKEGGLE